MLKLDITAGISQTPVRIIALSLALAAAILAFDLLLPLGVAGAIPYVGLVLVGLWSPRRDYVLVLATLGTVLTLIGYALSPAGGVPWVVAANRGLAVLGIWAVAILIFGRMGAEQALRESETRFRKIFEEGPLGMATIGPDYRFTAVNENLCKMLGYTERELKALTFADITHPDDIEKDAELAKQVFAGDIPRYQLEKRYITKSNEVLWASLSASVMHDEEDRPIGGLAIIEDISERKRTEEQLQQAQKMQAVGKLTAGVAHEFNNMLTSILGFAELLRDRIGEDEVAKRFLDRIGTSAWRGAEITYNMLAFGRMQALRPTVIDLNEMVAASVELLSGTLGENIEIKTVLAPDPWPARADENQLQHALINLTLNARDAMPKGGTLTIETGKVEIDEAQAAREMDARPGDYVVLAVSDTGSGIPYDIQKRIFEPFFTTRDVGKGTGLGLSMVYGFAQQSLGFVTLRSEPGQGARIELHLPRAAPEAASK